MSLSKLVGAIKTSTSLWVRRENFPEVTHTLWGDRFWSPSYFVTSIGGAPLERVAAYVRDQRESSRAPGETETATSLTPPHGRGLRSETRSMFGDRTETITPAAPTL
ncbi:hypothetical protein B2J88_01395 [Rhodococcus sp. SRB_17]|uniref:transposase n=1 Tax=Rhodococcus sp. OK302 TaxID=1882769 RepID=UPI000B93CFB6|nr:hypothetical protein [Rhodococcus sp. SRB_17]